MPALRPRALLPIAALLASLVATSVADAAAQPNRLWYRIRADVVYTARGTDAQQATFTDARTWSLRTAQRSCSSASAPIAAPEGCSGAGVARSTSRHGGCRAGR